MSSLLLLVVGTLLGTSPRVGEAERLAKGYADEVRKINEKHARKPGDTLEKALAKSLPSKARKGLEKLSKLEASPEVLDALVACGEAALDLDLLEDFERVHERLAELDAGRSTALGIALSRERVLVRGIGGLEEEWLEHFADVLDVILDAYDEVFAFEEWSKVPGKKLRVRVHLEEQITRPPHFAPQFPFHSEIDFPVADATAFRSPTPDGKFLFYGLCHELGHVIAMWGDRRTEEDHHAWAHYTGVAIVERLAASKKPKVKKTLQGLDDVRWRSLEKERDRLTGDEKAPSLEDRDGVLALLVALHDVVGPEKIGEALNSCQERGRLHRINHVRYYRMKDFRDGLLRNVKGRDKKRVEKIFP